MFYFLLCRSGTGGGVVFLSRTNSAHALLYIYMPAFSIYYTNKLVLTDTAREAYVTI